MIGITATLELALPATTAAPAQARAAIDEWLAEGPQEAPIASDARLLVTELVSNGVRHARPSTEDALRLRAMRHRATLRIEVWNAGVEGVVAAAPPRMTDEVSNGGFGLNLVAMLASAWGVERDGDGTTVWLELPG